jgi:peptidyl-prolyl cis-trans isomerase C
MQGACFRFALPDNIRLKANQWRDRPRPARPARSAMSPPPGRQPCAIWRAWRASPKATVENAGECGHIAAVISGHGKKQDSNQGHGEFMRLKFSGVAVVMAALLLPATASAQSESGSKSKVVATVNGYEITASEVQLAADDILPQLGEVPANLRFPFVVEYLMERHLLAQAAVKEGITETEEYKRRLAFYQAKALRDAYFAAKLKPSVTDEAVKKSYDEQAAKVATEERARARHILVSSEQEAKDISARLAKGEDFEALAKEYSLDGSKEFGGDLGFFTADEMVPAFSEAAFALKVGEVSQPVQTEFGWHLIKLEDRRVGGAQPFEDVENAIRMVLLRQSVQDRLVELRRTATIEVHDPDLKRLQEMTEKQRDEIDGLIESGTKQNKAD